MLSVVKSIKLNNEKLTVYTHMNERFKFSPMQSQISFHVHKTARGGLIWQWTSNSESFNSAHIYQLLDVFPLPSWSTVAVKEKKKVSEKGPFFPLKYWRVIFLFKWKMFFNKIGIIKRKQKKYLSLFNIFF